MAIKINGMPFKNVAVMSTKNVAGDFICAFDGPSIGEIPVNPSNDGVIFFRWLRPVTRDGESTAQAELRYFEALHKTVGLDGVVTFGNYYRDDGLEVGAGVKELDPKLKIMHVVMSGDGDGYKDFATASVPYAHGREKETLVEMLGLTKGRTPHLDRRGLHGVVQALMEKFPILDDPEALAAIIPSQPRDMAGTVVKFPENSRK